MKNASIKVAVVAIVLVLLVWAAMNFIQKRNEDNSQPYRATETTSETIEITEKTAEDTSVFGGSLKSKTNESKTQSDIEESQTNPKFTEEKTKFTAKSTAERKTAYEKHSEKTQTTNVSIEKNYTSAIEPTVEKEKSTSSLQSKKEVPDYKYGGKTVELPIDEFD